MFWEYRQTVLLEVQCIDLNLALLIVFWIGAVVFTLSVSAGDTSATLPCPNGEWCLSFPLMCMVRRGDQQMWKEEKKLFYVRSYQEKIMCFYFLFLVLPKYLQFPLCWRGFYLQAITQCVKLLRFVGTLLSALCSAHRS